MNTVSINADYILAQRQLSRDPLKYTLKWRQNQLFVQPVHHQPIPYLPYLRDQDRLVDCLKHSPIKLVRLAPDLSPAQIGFWANACKQAGKMAFLQIPNTPVLPRKTAKLPWWCKRLFDQSLAILVLLLLSPLLIGLALLIRSQSPGPILFQQWRVGERGRLFQIYKFRTMIDGAEQLHDQVMGNQAGLHKHKNDPRITPIGQWMRKYSLDELPQLLNVIRGEMSIVGPRPWALYDAIRISPTLRGRLNALPGITGAWQITTRSHLLDLDAVTRCDLEYLSSWSFHQDLKILLLTIPKVLVGFGAY